MTLSRRHIHHHQPRASTNPFFPQAKRRGIYWRIVGLVLFLIISIVGVFFVSERYMAIKQGDVSILGVDADSLIVVQNTIDQQLARRRWFFIPQRWLLFFNASYVEQQLHASLLADTIQVKKQWPHQLIVAIHMKQPVILWTSGQESYLLDVDGLTLRHSDQEAQAVTLVVPRTDGAALVRRQNAVSPYPIVVDGSTGDQPTIGQQYAGEDLVRFIVTLNQILSQEPGMRITQYQVTGPHAEGVTAVTDQGWTILFNAKDDPQVQVKRLELILTQRVTDRTKLEYIDLRLGDKIFFK